MEQKKLYVKPEEEVVEFKMHQPILTESGEQGGGLDDARPFDFTDTDLDH